VANLGWKLDAVLEGWAPETLLDSYTGERRPHCERMVQRAWHNYRADNAIISDPTLDNIDQVAARERLGRQIVATRQTEWRSLGAQLDVRYAASTLIIPDGTPEPAAYPETYEPIARPGHRAPHVALPDGRSTLDLFRGRFTLLNVTTDAAISPLVEAFRTRHVPLDVEYLNSEDAQRIYGCAVALIRPDGIVAWRGNTCPPDPEAVVDQITGQVAKARSC
jgi:hypothetical protein